MPIATGISSIVRDVRDNSCRVKAQAGFMAEGFVPAINRVYETLKRKQRLALMVIWEHHQRSGITVSCLNQPP